MPIPLYKGGTMFKLLLEHGFWQLLMRLALAPLFRTTSFLLLLNTTKKITTPCPLCFVSVVGGGGLRIACASLKRIYLCPICGFL